MRDLSITFLTGIATPTFTLPCLEDSAISGLSVSKNSFICSGHFFLMLIWKLKGRQLALIIGSTAISFIINVVMVTQGMGGAYYHPWARLWQLSLGGAFAYMQSCRVADLHSPNINLVAGALCVAMLACGVGGYLMFLGVIPTRAVPNDAQKFVLASMEDWLTGTPGTSWTRASVKLITLGASARYVLYIGDSNMQQYYPRIEKMLADHPLNSRGAIFAARDWCAPVESDIPDSSGATSPGCRAFVHNAFEYAKEPKVDTVVISACWRCYFLSFEDSPLRSGRLNPGAEEAFSSLQREIGSLLHAGKRVYLILGTPVSADLDPRSMLRRVIVPPGFRVVISSPKRSDLAAAVEPITSRLLKIAQVTGAKVIDPMRSLCNVTTCSPVSPKAEPVYHDWFNLSPSYVRENVRFLDGTPLGPGPMQNSASHYNGDDGAVRRFRGTSLSTSEVLVGATAFGLYI